jgi:menaquinone-9 beta-reductase
MGFHDADALVIGGGPAGASCAIRLARAGWRVLLIEQSCYPRQKVCGECLGVAGLQLLDELGVGEQLRHLAGPEIRQVGWMTGRRTAIAAMPASRSGPHRYGRAIGRDTLDHLLLERARAVGVQIIQPARVRSINGAPGDFTCEYRRRTQAARAQSVQTASAALIIDAHGSWERAPAGQTDDCREHPSEPRSSDLFAFKASFRNAALPAGLLPVLSMPGGYGGMVIADRDRTTVACCLRRDALHECRRSASLDGAGAAVDAYLKHSCRGVALALENAQREGPWRSSGPLRPGFSAASAPGVLRIGNAAVEVHPLVGEGICMALQSAALLADLMRARPARIDAIYLRDRQRRYAQACQRAFAWRLQWSRCCAQMAMHRPVATPLAVLMQTWPHTLTLAARLAGKARAAAPPGSSVRRSYEYA